MAVVPRIYDRGGYLVSHHGREGEREECGQACQTRFAQLTSAIALIRAVADGVATARCTAYGGHSDPRKACDAWLERNGYECENSRRRARERRADELDVEIARLRAERARL